MMTAERQARQTLARTGKAVYQQFEIWETMTAQGEWSGCYRMAPVGQREHYRDYEGSTHTLRSIFARIDAEHP